jgi:hypothetical protein
VGQFKVGDNLVYNAQVLCSLVEANEGGALNKPIVVQVGSLLEAALGQIIYRAQNYKREGVPNVPDVDRLEIATKKVDKFSSIIDVLKKYEVLDGLGDEIYKELHNLRMYRNRVHIQEDVDEALRNDSTAFSDEICAWAFTLNLRVLNHLSDQFARPKGLAGYVGPLVIPSANILGPKEG